MGLLSSLYIVAPDCKSIFPNRFYFFSKNYAYRYDKRGNYYQGYEQDLEDMIPDPFVDRPRLLTLLKEYLKDQDIMANWDEIDHASDDLIINSLSMACPFKPIEKQALLEISSLSLLNLGEK